LLFFFAFAVRVIASFLSPVPLWDETVYSNLGFDLSSNFLHYSFDGGWSDFVPGGMFPHAGFRAPLLPAIMSFFFLFDLEFLINLFIPLVGALSVVLLYYFAKDLFNEGVAKYSSTIFAILPLHSVYSGKILTGVLCTFFLILTFLSFWRGFELGIKKYKLFFGFFLSLAFLTRYTTLWIMPIFLLYFLIRYRSLNFFKDNYLWYAILVFFVTLIPYFLYSFFDYGNIFGAVLHGVEAAKYWGGVQPWYFFFLHWFEMFSIIGIVFLFSLIYIFYKKLYIKKEIYLLLIWIFFFLIIAIFVPHKETRFILPIVPPLVLISGFFINKLKNKKLIISIVFIILLISTAFSFGIIYNTYHNINTQCFMGVVSELEEKENILIVSENPPIYYYFVKNENRYYPDELNVYSIKNIVKNTDKQVYFVFTKFNSGFEYAKFEFLKEILSENYNEIYSCELDSNVNFIYVSNIE